MRIKSTDWNFLTKSGLNYQGPVFMRKKPSPPTDRLSLLTSDVRHCKRCGKDTRHEKVRDLDTIYWRCTICVTEQVKNQGIYLPPHLDKRTKASLKERIKK